MQHGEQQKAAQDRPYDVINGVVGSVFRLKFVVLRLWAGTGTAPFQQTSSERWQRVAPPVTSGPQLLKRLICLPND
jgi:hypothetical protein